MSSIRRRSGSSTRSIFALTRRSLGSGKMMIGRWAMEPVCFQGGSVGTDKRLDRRGQTCSYFVPTAVSRARVFDDSRLPDRRHWRRRRFSAAGARRGRGASGRADGAGVDRALARRGRAAQRARGGGGTAAGDRGAVRRPRPIERRAQREGRGDGRVARLASGGPCPGRRRPARFRRGAYRRRARKPGADDRRIARPAQ